MDIWLPLLVALLGIGGTLAGVWMTQQSANRMDAARRNFEQEQRAAQQARDDALRTFEHRRDAYVSYAEQWEQLKEGLMQIRDRPAPDRWPPKLPRDYFGPLLSRLSAVRIYGTAGAYADAVRSTGAFMTWAMGAQPRLDDSTMDAFIETVRADLKVSD